MKDFARSQVTVMAVTSVTSVYPRVICYFKIGNRKSEFWTCHQANVNANQNTEYRIANSDWQILIFQFCGSDANAKHNHELSESVILILYSDFPVQISDGIRIQ